MYTSILYFCMRICYLGTLAIFFTLRFTQVLLLKIPVFNTCISKLSYSIVTFVVSVHIQFSTKFEMPMFRGYTFCRPMMYCL
jgi:hypothetical protein